MRRRFLVPEVIQTSAMDCGPAALKSIFGGFGVYLSYGRLREACQTDIDGTSIDALESVAGQLGLSAEQSMLPADLLLRRISACLPALVVTRLPDGGAHFVVLWRVHGRWVQIMDPAVGRLWMDRNRFLASLYLHEQVVPRSAWAEWTASPVFTAGLQARLRELGLPPCTWPDPAHLDAALRLAGALRAAGRLRRGSEARDLLALCAASPAEIPAQFWCGRPADAAPDAVILRGAVLLTVQRNEGDVCEDPLLRPELARIRSEPPPRALAPVAAALREGGWPVPAFLAGAVVVSALAAVFEAFLFRGVVEMGGQLDSNALRLAAVTALALFLVLLLAIDGPVTLGLLRLGRHLESRLRIRFLRAVPTLGDRYFQSRLISDMAHRVHALQWLRQFPESVGQLLRSSAALVATAWAIGWFFPGVASLAWLAVALACAVPWALLPVMTERDLRLRETQATLSRFQLDAMKGGPALRAHGAQGSLRVAHARQLALWAEAGLRRQTAIVAAEGVQSALVLAAVVALVWRQAAAEGDPASLLLLAYWAASIPLLGRDLAAVLWSLPAQRNSLLRFLEPLGAPREPSGDAAAEAPAGGVSIGFRGVGVTAGGHAILEAVDLDIGAGEHVGIVGASGAGKSSLLGLLLGWHACAQGRIDIDGIALDLAGVDSLRRRTAWVDPQVHLFRRSLLDNLCFGNGPTAGERVGDAVERAGLAALLARLPAGLRSPLGDAGMLFSGGEGQAVRMARALARPGVRLVLLDEAGRGLDRPGRQRLLAEARQRFAGATLLCVSHDVADTLDLDRVVVVDQGRIVEQGPPRDLQRNPTSRYRHLLDQEAEVADGLWRHAAWRRLRLRGGRLADSAEAGR